MVEDKKQPIRKGLTDKDLKALSDILGNVTVTRSGMLRVMAFLVANPDLMDTISELGKDIKEIKKELKIFNERIKEMVEKGIKVIREAE